jgi:hypothetical protein
VLLDFLKNMPKIVEFTFVQHLTLVVKGFLILPAFFHLPLNDFRLE